MLKHKFGVATITGQCSECQEKVHKANQCPKKESRYQEGLARTLTGTAFTVDAKGTRK